MIKENCGIVAAAGHDITDILYHGLRTIQHRGQESAGISVFKDGVKVRKGKGLVHEVFDQKAIDSLSACKGIAHVRYSTTGGEDSHCYQPMMIHTSFGELALAHNGEIVNAEELRKDLLSRGGSLRTHSDSEVMLRLLAENITLKGDVIEGIRELMRILIGSYSMALLINDRIYVARDPLGIRPLCIGQIGDASCAASESVVFDSLGGRMSRDVRPGEIIEIDPKGFMSHKGISAPNSGHCFFEWIYFARPDSYIEGRIVYDVRRKVGMTLARENPVDADFVIPVPDSGRAHAIGYCEAAGIPYAEGLIKNRYIQRTFIMPNQRDRETAVNLKLNALRPVIEGKKVILVDDSIVRGTTMKKIVKLVQDAGSKEVHIRVGCPPIRAPCYLGIDIKNRNEFIANKRNVEQIGEYLGCDSIAYISLEGLVDAIGLKKEKLCLGCLTGEYPLKIKGERMRKE